MIDDNLQTNSYKRHLARDITQTIKDMSEERKQLLLSNIQLTKQCHNLTGQAYNTNNCQYIESLLQNKQPKPKLPS